MEENRLKPMPPNYDVALFNRLYKDTEGLRRKLASEINPRRFGLTYEDILAEFDVKFIFAFAKYHEESENCLRAHLIKALQFFKCRILRAAYTKKYSTPNLSLDAMEFEPIISFHEENIYREHYYEQLMSFMKANISEDAHCLLDLELNPTPFILNKLNELGFDRIIKIPDEIILEYFDLSPCDNSFKFLKSLRKEIKLGIALAKVHFRKN